MNSFMRNSVLTCILALGLTACGTDPTKAAVYTCTSVATFTDVAAEGYRAHKLNDADKAEVGAILDKAAVICEADTPPTSAQLQAVGMEQLVILLHKKGIL